MDIILISKKINFLRSFKIKRSVIYLCSIMMLGIILVTGVLITYNTRALLIEAELRASEAAYKNLSNQLDSLNSLLVLTHKRFDQYIAEDNRQRTFWQMAYIDPDVWSMGVGGKTFQFNDQELSHQTSAVLNNIYKELDVLKGKYYLRNKSLKHIDNQIKSKIALWSHKPSSHPLPGRQLGSGFGYRVDPINKKTIRMHWGVDIGAPFATDILATGDGVVSFTGWRKGYGWTVEIDHGFGFKTRYAHCSSILVKKGDLVKRGQAIAKVGMTGRAIAPHLHYEVSVSGVRVNPVPYIDQSSIVFD